MSDLFYLLVFNLHVTLKQIIVYLHEALDFFDNIPYQLL